jgi:ABC-type uncharacterized transport system permease subunit
MYYLFIVIVASLDVPRFGSYIQGDIQSEKYIIIDRLPIHPFNYYLTYSIGKSAVALVLYTLVILTILIIINAPLFSLVLFIPAACIAFILAHLITFLFSIIVFYFEQIHMWLFSIIFEFMSGKMIPLVLMPPSLAFILTWITPFGYAAGTLARFLSTTQHTELIIAMTIAVIWIMVLHKITHAFWTRGSYHFQEYNG